MEKEVSGRKISREIAELSAQLEKVKSPAEKKLIEKHLESLKNKLRKSKDVFRENLKQTSAKPLKSPAETDIKKFGKDANLYLKKFVESDELERRTLKRIIHGEKKEEKQKIKTASKYVNVANNLFSDVSHSLANKTFFKPLKRNLIKANLQFVPSSYISVILLTTSLAFGTGIFVFLFFLFFNIGSQLPIVTLAEGSTLTRTLKVFWIIFAIPLASFLFVYFYPSMEKKSAENRINQELPFVTIHMAAVSGSMIDPTNIFKIIISTGEYEYIGKEFTKLINEVNVYGYDLVSALRKSAFNSPSRKLADLFNGLATTISSGGSLPEFFDKRSQSLLFEYRLEREKQTRSAETFMDIYISVVIAAPMILMLLLIMMSVSGLGISLSAGTISLIMILGVSLVNVLFLVFLNLKKQ